MTYSLNDLFWYAALCCNILFLQADSSCNLPFYYNGEYETAEKGVMNANTTMIYQYPVNPLLGVNHLNFACREKQENTYLLKSTEDVNLFGQLAMIYLCMDIHQVSNETYYFFHRTVYEPFLEDYVFASKLREATFDEVCTETPDPRTFRLIVKSGALEEGLLNSTCPQDLLVVFDRLNITTMSGDKTYGCPGTSLDVCTNRSTLMFTYNDTCSKATLTSNSGKYNCLYSMSSGTSTYLGVWNHDETVDNTDTFRFSCFAYSYQNGILHATETPNSCTSTTTSTDLGSASDGIIITAWEIILRCPDQEPSIESDYYEESTDLSWLYFLTVGLGVVLLLALIVVLSCYFCKKYGCVCKRMKPLKIKIPKFVIGTKKQMIDRQESQIEILQEDKNFKSVLLGFETQPPLAHDAIIFKPKQQVKDFIVLSAVFKDRKLPTMILKPKVTPIYSDTLDDYLQFGTERKMSKSSIFRLDSGVFEDDLDQELNITQI